MNKISPQEYAYEKANINQDRGYQVIVSTAVFEAMALLAVIGRLVARKKQKVGLGWDDYLTLFAMACSTGMVITAWMLPAWGLGKHQIAVTPSEGVVLAKISFAFDVLFIPSLNFAKLSVLSMYWRIFRDAGRKFVWAIYFMTTYVVLLMVSMFLVLFIPCQWTRIIKTNDWTGVCVPPPGGAIGTSTANIISDILIFSMPQPIIWKLQMPMKRRLGVSLILLLGLFATVISAVRLPLTLQNGTTSVVDANFYSTTPFLTSALEPLTIIICACLPTMRILLQDWSPGMIGLNTLRSIVRRNYQKQEDSRSDLAEAGRAGEVGAQRERRDDSITITQSNQIARMTEEGGNHTFREELETEKTHKNEH